MLLVFFNNKGIINVVFGPESEGLSVNSDLFSERSRRNSMFQSNDMPDRSQESSYAPARLFEAVFLSEIQTITFGTEGIELLLIVRSSHTPSHYRLFWSVAPHPCVTSNGSYYRFSDGNEPYYAIFCFFKY